MVSMSAGEAWDHLMKQWDCIPLSFPFDEVRYGSAAGGSGDVGAVAAEETTSQEQRERTYELQAIELRAQVDEQRRRMASLEADVWKSEQAALRAIRGADTARGIVREQRQQSECR